MPEISGTVEAADETSFKLDGKWFKYSKKAQPQPEHVSVGQSVVVNYTESEWQGKPQRWVDKTKVLAGAVNGSAPSRDDAILWQVCIKAAVECCIAVAPTKAPTAEAVLAFAHSLYDGRPSAEAEEPDMVREPVEPGP
jgi:hypothetical protein